MTYTKIIDNINNRIETIISQRLSGTYQHVNIEPSNYNPKIDDEITITITVTDQNDDPIPNWTVPLQINGNSPETPIKTNNEGIATYNYTCNNWGLIKINVKSNTCFLNVTGWKTVQTGTRFTVTASQDHVNIYVSQPSNTTAGTSYSLGTINTAYRPKSNISNVVSTIAGSDGQPYGHIRCSASGELVLILSKTTYSTSGGLTVIGTLTYGR